MEELGDRSERRRIEEEDSDAVVYPGRGKAVFIDAGRTKKHMVLTVDRDGRSRVRSMSNLSRLAKLGVEAAYADQLFPTMYDDLQRLLEAGVRVYRLKRLGLIASFRELNGLAKNDRNDTKVLRAIYDDTVAKFGDIHRRFGEISLEEVRLMMLLQRYRTIQRMRHRLLNANSTTDSANLKAASKAVEKEADELERQITSYAVEKLPGFKEFLQTLTEELQKDSKRSIASEKFLKAELVEIYTMMDETRGFHPIRRLFGLYQKTRKKYSRRARKALKGLAMTYANILGYKREVFDVKWEQRLLWTTRRLKKQTLNSCWVTGWGIGQKALAQLPYYLIPRLHTMVGLQLYRILGLESVQWFST